MTVNTDTRDPFATTATDPNEVDSLDFDDPGSDFVTIHDIDGRTVCVFPKEIRREAAKDPKPGKETFEKVVADVIVLDGPVTDAIQQVPGLIPDMHLSAGAVVAAIRGNVRTKRPIMGRIDSRPSRNNRQVKAYGLQAVDAATKAKYAPAVRQALASGIDG